MSGKIWARLAELGITLPAVAAPVANYAPFIIDDKVLYISGQVPFWNGGLHHIGKVGADCSIEDAIVAAKLCGLNILAQTQVALDGNLDRVKRILKVGGFVNSTPEFKQHPEVVNGASDLFVAVFGDAGRHSRLAVGVNSLPRGVAVEIDATIAIE